MQQEVFTDGTRHAHTVIPESAEHQILVVEVQQLGAAYAVDEKDEPILDENGQPQLVVRGVWSLQINPREQDARETESEESADEHPPTAPAVPGPRTRSPEHGLAIRGHGYTGCGHDYAGCGHGCCARELRVEVTRDRAHDLGDALGVLPLGITAPAQNRLNPHLQQFDHVLDEAMQLLRWTSPCLSHRRQRVEQPDGQSLGTAPALGDAELQALTGLQRLDALRQRGLPNVDVPAAVLRDEAEPLVRVVPLDLAGRHCPSPFLLFSCNGPRRHAAPHDERAPGVPRTRPV